jgi:hypothetical protein
MKKLTIRHCKRAIAVYESKARADIYSNEEGLLIYTQVLFASWRQKITAHLSANHLP